MQGWPMELECGGIEQIAHSRILDWLVLGPYRWFGNSHWSLFIRIISSETNRTLQPLTGRSRSALRVAFW